MIKRLHLITCFCYYYIFAKTRSKMTTASTFPAKMTLHARAPLPVLTRSRSRNRACLKPNVKLYAYLVFFGKKFIKIAF